MGYLICSKCKIYHKLEKGESPKDFARECYCGARLRYVENLDIVDPRWRQSSVRKKPTTREILDNKIESLRSKLDLKIKTPILQFWNNFKNRFINTQNWNNNYRTSPGMPHQYINQIINELNFNNLQWPLIIPFALLITIIFTLSPGILTILIFFVLAAMGYVIKDPVIGTKNALITGAISFFFGSLLTESFLLLIPLTLIGAVNGAFCGMIGAYITIKR